MKYFRITLLILIFWSDIYAAGIFNFGLMAGAASDAGDVSNIAGDINSEMRSVGTTVTEIESTYAPVCSVNFAYINDALIVKASFEYSTNNFYNLSGSAQAGAAESEVDLNYSRFTFPISLGIVIPLSGRNRFYFAGGVNMSSVIVVLKQSDPVGVALPSYPDKSHTFSAYIAGTNLKFGAETLMSRNYSFAVEFTKYFGNTKKIKSEDANCDILMGMNSFEVTAGINYNIDFEI